MDKITLDFYIPCKSAKKLDYQTEWREHLKDLEKYWSWMTITEAINFFKNLTCITCAWQHEWDENHNWNAYCSYKNNNLWCLHLVDTTTEYQSVIKHGNSYDHLAMWQEMSMWRLFNLT